MPDIAPRLATCSSCVHRRNTQSTIREPRSPAKHLADKAVLDVDASRVRAGEIAHQLLERRRTPERIGGQHREPRLDVCLQAGSLDVPGILQGLSRERELPLHCFSVRELFASGSAMPLRMDSRTPGTDSRYIVSWMEAQSSAQTRTAADVLPAIVIGRGVSLRARSAGAPVTQGTVRRAG